MKSWRASLNMIKFYEDDYFIPDSHNPSRHSQSMRFFRFSQFISSQIPTVHCQIPTVHRQTTVHPPPLHLNSDLGQEAGAETCSALYRTDICRRRPVQYQWPITIFWEQGSVEVGYFQCPIPLIAPGNIGVRPVQL